MTVLNEADLLPTTKSYFRSTPQLSGLFLGLLAVLIWGGYLAMAKAGTNAGLQATDIAFIRYGVAGLIMLPWLLRNEPRTLGGVGLIRAGVLALLVGPLFILIGVGGYAFAPLAHGAVMQPACLAVGGMILAALVLNDRPNNARVIGIAIIVCGLAIIAGPGLLVGTALTPLGDLMFAIAGLMWAGFTVVARRWGISPLAATAAVSVVSAGFYVPVYLAFVGIDRLVATPAMMLVAQVIVQGVLSGVVAVIAYTRAVQLLGAAKAAIFPALVPAVAIIIGIPVTGEIPTSLQLVGLCIVTLGLLTAMGVMRIASSSKTTQ
jgi:drug/metabolite transporter (DMT)-like permease